MLTRCLAILTFALWTTGCAVNPFPNRQCDFVRVPVEVPLPRGAAPVPDLQQILREAYARDADSPEILLMSGGSEHGSFGAGVLSAWGDKHGRLPDFELVTGVSTGAILASPAFAGDHRYAAGRYANVQERELLKAYGKKRNGDIALSSVPSVARHGAVASLEPLRNLLREYLVDQGGFEKIAGRANTGKLLVGAVDVDSGKMVAFDMTDMAVRIVKAQQAMPRDEQQIRHLRDCYYDAVIASASAPLAATPVFIDNRMYADGGMRYSLFGEKVMEVVGSLKRDRDQEIADAKAAHQPEPAPLKPPKFYLIVNGTADTEAWCRHEDKGGANCDVLANPELPATSAPKKWDLLSLGLRSVDILSNQVSRFSVRSLELENESLFGKCAGNFHFLRIESPGNGKFDCSGNPVVYEAGSDHVFPRPPASGGMSCKDWRKGDEERDQPLQFHHDYMACMVDYGKLRAETDAGW